jgi:Ca2+-transporting ATPase
MPPEDPHPTEVVALEQLTRQLRTARETGLTVEEATIRLAAGRNELPSAPGPSLLDRIWRNAKEPMSLLLIAAAAISVLASGEVRDAIAIVAIVILNIAVAVAQEERASSALEALRSEAAPTASVLRDSSAAVIPAGEVVPGDIVLLAAGDRVPADLWLIASWSMEANESLLTGESLPVAKIAAEEGDMAVSMSDQSWIAHAGSLITAGSGRGVVFATGSSTALGRIASHLTAASPTTPLQRQLGRLSTRLGQAAVVIAVIVFGLTAARLGGSASAFEQAFLAAVALAVAAVPEGLPAVVTLSLALGVGRMAREGAIVRNLPAVETLGSTTVLLTDKTGTLTLNRMRLAQVTGIDGEPLAPSDLKGPVRKAVLDVVALCNDATLDPPRGDPVEIALLEGFERGEIGQLRSLHPRVGNIPFDSQRKLMSTLHRGDAGFELLTKGAPEHVLQRSELALTADGSERPMTPAQRLTMLSTVDQLAGTGARILALAMRRLDSVPESLDTAEERLVFLGLAVLHDPLRPEAADTVQRLTEAGVRLVMVTGDHAGTASAVARAAGLTHEASEVLTGTELRSGGIPDDLGTVSVYARVEPEQKLDLVEAFQTDGQVVAVTGDGVNDAPALRRADIGVAMGRDGSQVAREAADLVITDDDLRLVVKAVYAGRAIFDNIRKVVDYLVAGNLSEVTVVLVGLGFFPGIGIPLLPLQLLWVNLLTDGLPALALAFDRPRGEALSGSLRGSQLLSKGHLGVLAVRGLVLASGPIAALAVIRSQGASWQVGRTALLTSLVFAHLLYVYVVRLPLSVNLSNHRLTAAVGLGLLLQVALVLGPLGDVFGVLPLDPGQWLVALIAGVTPVALLWSFEAVRLGMAAEAT